jgi:hypothetical protein
MRRSANPCLTIASWIHAGRCELGEGPRERRLVRHLLAAFPSANPPEPGVRGEAIEQGAGRGQVEHGLGDEGAGDGAAVFGRTTAPARRWGDMALEAEHVENQHDAFVLNGQFVQFLTQPREQRSLDMAPPLEKIIAT